MIKETKISSAGGAEITVGVLTRNSARTIPHVLHGLSSQSLDPSRWRVIFIDHSSSDSTRQYLDAFVARSPHARLVDRVENNVARSRQWIVEEARTRWIAFVDSDVILPDHWLSTALEAAEREARRPMFAGLCGPLVMRPLHRRLAAMTLLPSRFAGHFGTEQMSQPRRPRACRHLPTAAALFRREALETIGGFRTELGNCGEDLELGTNLRASGYEQWMTPSLAAHHLLSCETISQWSRRAFRFGRARVRVAALHPFLWRERQIIVPLALVFFQLALLIGAWAEDRRIFLPSFVALHFAFLITAFFDPRNICLSGQAVIFTWLTHQAYAWGEACELTLQIFRWSIFYPRMGPGETPRRISTCGPNS